jgi:hypothetical protein
LDHQIYLHLKVYVTQVRDEACCFFSLNVKARDKIPEIWKGMLQKVTVLEDSGSHGLCGFVEEEDTILVILFNS